MQFDDLLKLVQEVGKAGLSDFEYTEGNVHIKMSAVKKDAANADRTGQEGQPEPGDFEVETNISLRNDKEIKKEVIEAPVEGIFYYSMLDGTACPVQVGDRIEAGQVIGILKSRGRVFEITSEYTGEVLNIYIEDGEEIVAREPMLMLAV